MSSHEATSLKNTKIHHAGSDRLHNFLFVIMLEKGFRKLKISSLGSKWGQKVMFSFAERFFGSKNRFFGQKLVIFVQNNVFQGSKNTFEA